MDPSKYFQLLWQREICSHSIMASAFLFWSILINTFTYALINVFVKIVLAMAFRKDPIKVTYLKRIMNELKSELNKINMVDEFARYAKLKRKIAQISQELTNENNKRSSSMLRVKVTSSIILHILCGIYAFHLLWYYRDEPVLHVPHEWLYPINKVIAFPIEKSGTIGITIWLAICSTVAKVAVATVFTS